MRRMDIVQMDDHGALYLSPAIDDWAEIHRLGITAVFDLEEGIDAGVPTVPGGVLYIYFHFSDEGLPDMRRLRGLADLGAYLCRTGHRVLVHCTMGLNRSALLTGKILYRLGMRGPDVVERLRERRPGALYNEVYASYLTDLD